MSSLAISSTQPSVGIQQTAVSQGVPQSPSTQQYGFPYPGDGYNYGNPFYGQPAPPIDTRQIIWDPRYKISSMINRSDELLKWGSTPFKRKILSRLVDFWTNGQHRDFINRMIPLWVGQADLVRTGLDINTIRLLTAVGVLDVPSLAIQGGDILGPFSLWAKLSTAALQYRTPVPNYQTLIAGIQKARTLPPLIRWY